MILDLDIGNSRIKWRVTFADGRKGQMCFASMKEVHARTFRPIDDRILRIRVSSVRAATEFEGIADWAEAVYGVRPEQVSSTAQVGRVRNGYNDPKKLGIDRWLAVIAAYDLVGDAVCVMDFGSAVTADVVDKTGLHLGGFIAPGMKLMRDSLASGTDLVRFSDQGPVLGLHPGRSTADAVEGGVLAASVGFANMCWQCFQPVARPVKALITGGDGATVLDLLAFPASLEPSLVLDGIPLAAP